MNAVEMKERERASWTAVAPGWRKHDARLTGAFGPVSERLLDLVGVSAGKRVLDMACGTGEPAIPAAVRVGSTGFVLATDLVGEMIAFAREKAQARGLANIEFRETDGELLDLPPASFDAVTMRWGLMFMPDPVAALKGAKAALKAGGRIALSNWGPPDRNPWAAIPLACIRKYIEIPPPVPGQTGLFSFANPGCIRTVMGEAGFQNIEVEPFDVVWQRPTSGAAYFDEVIEIAGPLASLYSRHRRWRQAGVCGRRGARGREAVDRNLDDRTARDDVDRVGGCLTECGGAWTQSSLRALAIPGGMPDGATQGEE